GLLCSFQDCFVCGERGATITCQEVGCDRRFHLPCAVEGECVTRYLPPSRSFCQEHHPQQQDLVAPEGTVCLICMDPVEGRTTYGTMVCPACRTTWFHRACIQEQAMHSGILCLQCPLCRNRYQFLLEMINMGIQIPFSLQCQIRAYRSQHCQPSSIMAVSWISGSGVQQTQHQQPGSSGANSGT
ncbi:G2/M phase-specific E3 ubiquitin-protein ligase-like, partial [Pezoporus flaviventris]|uniref:G2/M phase-specific E3 ubiquitin-protein ligase-like n=1 Tax=Pezoporus flaviventris TaxID=889875 RepID=UPI002AB2D144